MKTLVEAIESGDTGEVWRLAQDGAALEALDEATELMPLAIAAESGQAEIVRILLAAGADPNRGGATTPLEAAVVEGQLEVVKALIEASVDVDRKVGEGFTPLMTAAATGNLRMVSLLLGAGARPLLRNDDGETAVSLAEGAGHDKVVELLREASRRQLAETRAPTNLEADAEASGPGEAGGSPGDTEVDDPALSESDDRRPPADGDAASAPDGTDGTALDLLTMGDDGGFGDGPPASGIHELFDLEELVFDGVDEPSGGTADSEASSGQDPSGESQSLFSDLGSEPWETPVPHFAAPAAAVAEDVRVLAPVADEVLALPIEESFAEALEELESLLEGGDPGKIRAHLGSAAITEPDEAGRTALMAAAHLGEPAIVQVLVDAGGDVNACDRTDAGQTPLIYAVNSLSRDRDEVVAILVSAGADLDRGCGRNQRTALMHAAEADVYLDREQGAVFAQTTKKLVELGAALEVTDRRGRTVWRLIKRDALGAPTFAQSRRRLHHMLRVLEYLGAQPIASHQV